MSSCLIVVEKCKNPWQYCSSRYSNKISEVTNKQYGVKSIHNLSRNSLLAVKAYVTHFSRACCMQWRRWLRCYATSWKVAGLSPNEVIYSEDLLEDNAWLVYKADNLSTVCEPIA
jgi:hypothetical protein